MKIVLEKATESDMKEIWKMQVEAFKSLLEKYQDYDMSPATESYENLLNKFKQPWTKYFFIVRNGEKIGVVRVIDKEDGSRKRISPIWIMPLHRNQGLAQLAIKELERLYGSSYWELDTILQEQCNIYLYEKLGYKRIDKIEHIKEGMDIVFFQKD
ncbi:acetyltransferase [Gemella morbillorum M424]|uniref:GNAT family N-acetyltransferase n=1 Tax=Gemella morbillorum TaxID=29391 RepID=A0AAP9HDP9_9BACL|nr:GNAT family N-acetyltransferase [Gemella morbillorum]EFV36234.1 acetyltransferase [Gemella morbillorum M424]QGS09532.1 GNAT family N-acetyltransferase [Gemella morbillorum]